MNEVYISQLKSLELSRKVCEITVAGTTQKKGSADQTPDYSNIVVLSEGILMVIDRQAQNLRLHQFDGGKLLSVSDKLQAVPRDVCICVVENNQIEVAVSLDNSEIEIMTVKSTGDTSTITRVRTIDVKKEFEICYTVEYLKLLKKIVVSGRKLDSICWGIVPFKDGQVDTIYPICKAKYSWSHMATNDNMIYISCHAGLNSPDNGVYGFDITRSTQEFRYEHPDLKIPMGISLDTRGFIYVCNWDPPCIHQFTGRGKPVTVHSKGIPSRPYDIYWEAQQGQLFITSRGSNVVKIFRPQYSDQSDTGVIPAEILRMDNQSIQLFKEALKEGEVQVYNIRVMVVGHSGVGKTTLIKRLLEKEVHIKDEESTDGIYVHVHCCRVSRDTLKWTVKEGDSEQNLRLQRLAKALNDKLQKKISTDKKEELVILPEETVYEREKKSNADDKDTKGYHLPDDGEGISSSSASDKVSSHLISDLGVIDTESATNKVSDNQSVEMLKLLCDNADKLKEEREENVPLTMVDFAGQYVFYTTHQTFLTERAIYLLVSNINEQVTDAVEDDCYLDIEGIKSCKVYELVDVWLNSIHSCAPSPDADTPPVILVGTHMDKIQQDSREEVCENYFQQLRCEYLVDKPTIVHLADDDFAIDNTVIDPKLDKLKEKIVQLASKQRYWGELIPARWLALEEYLMKLKAAHVKVIPYSQIEKMNEEGAVKIESREELELFLRFQHNIGNILYFGTEELKKQIMLDPQWLIYALRTLITAEKFIKKKTKQNTVIQKWREFKKTGKLTQELIDAIWTKEMNSDFHDCSEFILGLMEKLNIIARPRSFIKTGDESKVENYFIAPCMLRAQTPIEVICPGQHPEMETSSILCYNFTGKFLPSPIFHRLLAACVAHWPIAKKKSINQIFCGCCVFEINSCHKLTLYFKDYVIFARVDKMSKRNKTPDSEVCIKVREFIDINLSVIIGSLCQNLKFEMYIQCPQSQANSLHGMFPVMKLQEEEELRCYSHESEHLIVSQDLLKFWFKDERRGTKRKVSSSSEEDSDDSSDGPITQEHINHARLCNLLTTVCADALRKILKAQVPVPYADIYQAILANKANLTSRRQVRPGQWQNALLNNAESQLVFPNPQGQNTGRVEDFDISLLYLIIRNVSSVPNPTTGWGNPPTDQPRDTSLGANAERIRLYRNSISGHSVGGKINQQEFEDYWNKIGAVLHDIANVIGDQGYKEELEKRKNQVITPHEAHEYKKRVGAATDKIQLAAEAIISAARTLKRCKN